MHISSEAPWHLGFYSSEQSPWHVDPVPAAGEDEDHAAVAEEGEEEHNPDSTSEGPPGGEGEIGIVGAKELYVVPPIKQVVARQERSGSWVAIDSLRGSEVAGFHKIRFCFKLVTSHT